MRLLIASMAALAALAFAAPSFAQTEEPSAAPAPVPTTKPKPGTTAYCQTLKSSTSRSACMKKLHAQATPKAAPTTTKKKTKKTTTATTPARGRPAQPAAGRLFAGACSGPDRRHRRRPAAAAEDHLTGSAGHPEAKPKGLLRRQAPRLRFAPLGVTVYRHSPNQGRATWRNLQR